MENEDERRAVMVAQARESVAEAKYREHLARLTTTCVTGALALGLREQGLSDKAIGEILGVSRNRISDLVNMGLYPSLYAGMKLGDQRERGHVTSEVEAIYGPLSRPASGWLHTKTDRSGVIAHENGIPLPATVKDPANLDLDGAQFDNLDTGERVIVYSLMRHYGQPLFDSGLRRVGADFKGEYQIALCTADGAWLPYPLEILGIGVTDLRFGKKWEQPTERRTDEHAYFNAVRAVRRHYGIWARAVLTEDAEYYNQ